MSILSHTHTTQIKAFVQRREGSRWSFLALPQHLLFSPPAVRPRGDFLQTLPTISKISWWGSWKNAYQRAWTPLILSPLPSPSVASGHSTRLNLFWLNSYRCLAASCPGKSVLMFFPSFGACCFPSSHSPLKGSKKVLNCYLSSIFFIVSFRVILFLAVYIFEWKTEPYLFLMK